MDLKIAVTRLFFLAYFETKLCFSKPKITTKMDFDNSTGAQLALKKLENDFF